MRGRENFIAVNANYPAAGRWRFTINRLVADEGTVVSDVGVTDGALTARAITFSTLRDGKIIHQIEFWPTHSSMPPGEHSGSSTRVPPVRSICGTG